MIIRDFRPDDSDEIADLFHASVHSLSGENFSEAQLEAWAPTPPNYSSWRARLGLRRPYVADGDGVILGFIELEDDGHIDCFYVHPSSQRRGIGKALFDHLLRQAEVRGIRVFHVEASAIARPFFEREGFQLERTNQLNRGGQTLINYSMNLKRPL